ncbi:DNA-3-methyladenine glycosylase [Candidatus Saccharibacteria bacterium]|nr:DNA-3-methyladenine glycosylase [Candidatus Saccharibacteria bacterium]
MKDIVKLPAVQAAPLLLGCYLVRQLPAGRLKVKIVETEAYHQDDPASHSFAGLTKRTAPMFEAGGRLYVYFTYGMHYCLNIVTGETDRGEAVLIRAGEPLEGIEIMQANRGISDIRNLTNGPAKLAQALAIYDTSLSGEILNKSSILLQPGETAGQIEVTTGPRIGISKAIEQPWRFYIKDNPFVSRV